MSVCYIVDGQRDTKLRGLIAACLECDPRTVSSNYKAMTGYEVDILPISLGTRILKSAQG